MSYSQKIMSMSKLILNHITFGGQTNAWNFFSKNVIILVQYLQSNVQSLLVLSKITVGLHAASIV